MARQNRRTPFHYARVVGRAGVHEAVSAITAISESSTGRRDTRSIAPSAFSTRRIARGTSAASTSIPNICGRCAIEA